MENFIYTLVVMVISGVTFLAYKHPEAYQKIYPILAALLLAAISGLGAWNYGVTVTGHKLDDLIDPSKGVEALNIIRELEFPFFVQLVAPIIVSFYLVFLSFLPNLLGKHENNT